ncbi:hypothetical protein QF032_000542 [Streptomyces achromogenes]|uniref:Uncharacterized protein n=1 Tax=Streptomyces achromogenes TaxID=67255 RepID=A0ABU0PT21_STRAH|nr:hypothetical protein [Streptomyces achromogenes]MDQ0828698.1 hypothetical protein [Streptomyces achromogenes]
MGAGSADNEVAGRLPGPSGTHRPRPGRKLPARNASATSAREEPGYARAPGWTFAGVATQQVVAPERAGEAPGVLLTFLVTLDGVVLTFLVTLGEVALAAAAGTITAMTPQRTPQAAYDATLRLGGAAIPAASAAVTAVRRRSPVRDRARLPAADSRTTPGRRPR